MSIGLVMIVKDEAHALLRLAVSLRGQIDHATIVDTGSTDGTLQLLPTLFGVPTLIIEDEWRGFGPSRQVALVYAAEQTDWLLVMDADETFEGTVEIPDEVDLVNVEERHGDLVAIKPRLMRSSVPWRYVGRTHEYLTTDVAIRSTRSHSFWVNAHNDGASHAEKFERDLLLLQEDWDEEQLPRTAFYLARTLDDLGRYAEAVFWYGQRSDMGGWDEEVWYSEWRRGVMLLANGKDETGCGALWAAYALRPHRAEPLVTLAEHYRREGKYAGAWAALQTALPCNPQSDSLFIHHDVYDWRRDYETSITAWYVGQQVLAGESQRRLEHRTDLPADIAASVAANAAFHAA